VKPRWDLVAGVYLLLAAAGAGLSLLLNGPNPLLHPSPRLALGPLTREAVSAALGIAVALLVTAGTRLSVAKADWARRLHEDLRPVAVGMGTLSIVAVSILSSLGEEMFFRSFLTPNLGIWIQAALFGLAHQVRGSSRWVWVGWAALVGLMLGGIYAWVGSLTGPLLAHALINSVNLAYLRDNDPNRPDPRLGGLLGTAVPDARTRPAPTRS
jgi:membrane protease YdiL (CAAX protease family)